MIPRWGSKTPTARPQPRAATRIGTAQSLRPFTLTTSASCPLGLGAALWATSRSGVILGVGLGTLQMAAYLASNPAVEMLSLAGSHHRASPEKIALEAAAQGVLAAWKGTAFLTYYFLGAIVLFIFAWLLWRSTRFGRATAWWALAAAVLMLVPSPFGIVGMAFSLASLVPWVVLCVLAGIRLLRGDGPDPQAPDGPMRNPTSARQP